ncbi:uncharacterized protein LOC123701502 [Colias croceus]|uniref:uncharacterized protein LOC123701502 n=1 Tax=Colias crocea TaxID=72248 RepID=UPI001E27DCBC|nr:uncharacterized protein LOC123701502 [Colias croceus]
MSAVKRKLKTLSLAEKLEVLEAVKRCQKKKDVAEQFGLPMSTLSTIIKNESNIIRNIQNGQSLSCKRRRIAEYPGLEECLFKWYEECRSQNISVSGPQLQEKAQIFSKTLGIVNFRASNGWLEKFKKRKDLVFKKVCGESANVNIIDSVVQKTDTNDLDDIEDVNNTIIDSVVQKTDTNDLDDIEDVNNTIIDSVVQKTDTNDLDDIEDVNNTIIDSVVQKTETNYLDDIEDVNNTIIDSVVQKTETNYLDDIEDVNNTCAPWVSIQEARTALITLRNFIEQTSYSKEEFSALYI